MTPRACHAHVGPLTRGTNHAMARTTPHSTPPHPAHNPPTTTGLRMGSPMVPPHRHQPHVSPEPQPHAQMALHHYTHLSLPRPGRGRHPLQHVRTRQHGQSLSAPPLLPHTGAPNTNPHMPRPKPRHSLHPPLHLLLPHTRTAGTGTHSHVPPSETHHLQRNRGVRHPPPAAHNPSSPPHHGPRHIRLPAHERMPPPTTLTGGPALLHRRLRQIRPHAHHLGGPPCS